MFETLTPAAAMRRTMMDALWESYDEDPEARYRLEWGGGSRSDVRLVRECDAGGPTGDMRVMVKGGRRSWALPDAAVLVVRDAAGVPVWNGPAMVWVSRGLDFDAAQVAAALAQ